MSVFRITYRGALLSIVVITGCLLSVFIHDGSMPRSGLKSKITCWWHKKITGTFGVSVRVFGSPSEDAALFIANHVSWLDIMVVGGAVPTHFLSKAEVKKWPLMGWLATRAGTLYIKRGGTTAATEAIAIMAHALGRQNHVALFAEGTTTDGTVKKFHSRLVQSAIESNSFIQPVAIRYPSKNGELVHPAAAYNDNMSMRKSVLNMLAAKDVVAEIHFLDCVHANGKNRDELARYAEEQVAALIKMS